MDKPKKVRIDLIDALRGIAVCAMILHHGMVLFEMMFDYSFKILQTSAFSIVQSLFVALFILISGICTNYSRNVLKNGIIVTSAAIIITVITAFILPAVGFSECQIYFGILHMFGLSMLLYALTEKPLSKINATWGTVIFAILFIAYYIIYLNAPLVDTKLLVIFGFTYPGFFSADFYPLLPYFFLFICGGYIGKFVKNNKFPKWFYEVKIPFFDFIGKHALLIYVIHQPIIFFILYLVSLII